MAWQTVIVLGALTPWVSAGSPRLHP